ncbi:MAG TPA: hypothetical protein VNN73_18290 [Blastocatellia bacterium]|nr:hypothetical protein [Blastocatellia bacterium]
MNKESRLSRVFLIALCVSVLAVGAAARQYSAQGSDKGNKNVHKIIHLAPTDVEPKATGIAKISAKMKGKKPSQDFQVVGANLKSGATYDLFVDGVKVGSQKAGVDQDDEPEPGEEGASVEFLFSSKAKVHDDPDDHGPQPLPESLNPVTKIKLIELKDSTGKVVLLGQFSTT